LTKASMPLVKALHKAGPCLSEEERLKKQLLDKLSKAAAVSAVASQTNNDKDHLLGGGQDDSDSISDCEEQGGEAAGGSQSLAEAYLRLEEQSKDIPLQKVVFSPEGIALFDELCLRVDVNQRYASVLPQWTDVAHLLEVDSLRTKWVETCVRPREGLTRAMLEIYMNDGGTLGEVIGALIKLECFDILETIRPKAERYIEHYKMGSKFEPSSISSSESQVNEKYFSVLKTLVKVLGQGDPCDELQRFRHGLKHLSFQPSPQVTTVHHVGLERSPPPKFFTEDKVSAYRSDLHLEQLKSQDPLTDRRNKCKILLLFSKDGVEAAEQFVQIANTVETSEVVPDVFRLNEVSLWYEVLSDPQACCLKWAAEADYIMPVLTPRFLQEIHCNTNDSGEDEGLLPTSPMLNRYLYILARSQYTQAGSKNLKVRPVIPLGVLRQVRTSNAVSVDPLLNSSWVPLNEERVTRRLTGMLKEWVKRHHKR